MLSEDKISHLSHIILQVVKKSALVTVQDEEGRILKEIKRVLASELAQEEDIDRKVRAKLAGKGSASCDAVAGNRSLPFATPTE